MATKVLMEALSPTMTEGKVMKWLKHEGDQVHAGDTLAEVETDKAIMELSARGDGVLRQVVVPEGSTVEVGKLVAVIARPEEDISGIAAATGGQKPRPQPAEPKSPEPAEAPAAEAPGHRDTAARQLAPKAPPDTPKPEKPQPEPQRPVQPGERIKASPLARKVARDRGVDLAVMSGTGPGGRIVKRDLEGATAAPLTTHPSAPLRAGHAPRTAPGAVRDVPLSQIRKTIAKRLVQSLAPIPHFFLTSEIDMERAWDAREALNALGDEQRISFNDIVVKAVALALVQHPECNAWWQDDHIRYFSDVHLGMAVAVEEGLITPVIRNAEAKSLREIAIESRDLVERARARKLKPEEYTGSTFSVSNLGMFDIEQFTAVINPPEAGILAVGTMAPRPVAHDGELVLRRRMRVTMSCDHRVIDGATGARFLQTLKRMLENPLAMVW
ncbi:MAG: pyruvate dehydrogenase complex dihydrolipoamide acetyltransferase [Gemmatimonadetes bacterium]|nr:pyruvate dehydrogenase complex dihydrolipoamide acetyltransferase [Gemmatimonadota bacterium]